MTDLQKSTFREKLFLMHKCSGSVVYNGGRQHGELTSETLLSQIETNRQAEVNVLYLHYEVQQSIEKIRTRCQ